MQWATVIDALKVANIGMLALAMKRPAQVRGYLARSARLYDDAASRGLPVGSPLPQLGQGVHEQTAIRLPSGVFGDGGTSAEEVAVLATATLLLRPRKIFEIGTFNGKTTAALILNSEPGTEILSLDLPPMADTEASNIASDRYLIDARRVAQCVYDMGLEDRFEQVFCNSLEFDESPHADSVDFAFIDGGHELRHVQSDTEKVARMLTDRGVVFWHDYGGKGVLRPLSMYLESLSASVPVYRVDRTSLAWAWGKDLRRWVAAHISGQRPRDLANSASGFARA